MDGGQTPNPHNMMALQRILRMREAAIEGAVTRACFEEPGARAQLMGSTAIERVPR
ncbi:hypothetical protein [uncultured Ruegeria sp.]|uniref:hypothetical protein n=1 Tax=uncultured Ruegeria sp. TaxID=259304 RepID=UPI0026044F80|nr:hypothetical protein [uncultured Ruegeria sp.]